MDFEGGTPARFSEESKHWSRAFMTIEFLPSPSIADVPKFSHAQISKWH